jgi:hypothetical protein
MNGDFKIQALEIEARLDRSLEKQIRAPGLDARFDAAVWARIAASEAKATSPAVSAESSRALRASRWLAITNSIGITVTLIIAANFVLRTFGGIESPVNLGVNVPVSMPVIPEAMVSQILAVLGQVLGFVALAFGLSLTPFGRRIRSAFS